MSFLCTFTCHIGHHIPLNSNNECSLGSGQGRQITSLNKNRRKNNSAVFGKTVEKKNTAVFEKNGGEKKILLFWKKGEEKNSPPFISAVHTCTMSYKHIIVKINGNVPVSIHCYQPSLEIRGSCHSKQYINPRAE